MQRRSRSSEWPTIQIPRTPLIGREPELREATAILLQPEVACLTLTGPGGVGKTRLGFQLASDLACDESLPFPDGVWVVEMAAVADPALVIPWIGRALGLQQSGDPLNVDGLASFLAGRTAVILLDNFEHVIDSAAELSSLLAASPSLKLITTSRRPLRIDGEREFPVEPLALPAPAAAEELDTSPAVRLFVERATAVAPQLATDPASLAIVADICRRVDGLPLAIELAAARAKTLSLAALQGVVSHRLSVLTGGRRDAPERQQTVRATIAWSYELLTVQHRTLYRRLSVLAGTFGLDDAVAVTGTSLAKIVDGIDALIDQSVLSRTTGSGAEGSPYRMLQTIREYGLEQLDATAELIETRNRHADHFLALAETAEPFLKGPAQGEWLDRLEGTQANLDAALEWLLANADAARSLRLGAALWRFWSLRGYSDEGRRWLQRSLELDADVDPTIRARALRGFAHLAEDVAAYDEAATAHQAAMALWRESGDLINVSQSLSYLGCCAHDQSDFVTAAGYHAEALAVALQISDARSIALAYSNRGTAAFRQGEMRRAIADYEAAIDVEGFDDPSTIALFMANIGAAARQIDDLDRAMRMANESLAIYRAAGDRRGIATALMNVADLRLAAGDAAAAESQLKEAHELLQAVNMPYGELAALINLSSVTRSQGNLAASLEWARAGLILALRGGFRVEIADLLELVADAAARLGALNDGARLWATASAVRDETGAVGGEVERREREHRFAGLREALAAQSGPPMTDRQAAHAALGIVESLLPRARIITPVSPMEPPASSFNITPRELDVLRLLVEGRSDREIAESLFISVKTASTHVSNILGKLNVDSRTAAATLAVRHALV